MPYTHHYTHNTGKHYCSWYLRRSHFLLLYYCIFVQLHYCSWYQRQGAIFLSLYYCIFCSVTLLQLIPKTEPFSVIVLLHYCTVTLLQLIPKTGSHFLLLYYCIFVQLHYCIWYQRQGAIFCYCIIALLYCYIIASDTKDREPFSVIVLLHYCTVTLLYSCLIALMHSFAYWSFA